MAAMESLMRSPPANVQSWEALMVRAAKMRALDILGSAAVRHGSSEDPTSYDQPATTSVEDDVIEAVDRQRAAAVAWDKLALLDERHRKVAWEYIAKERPRGEVAVELGVTPARVSQMAAKALQELKEALAVEGVEP
jgi:RNA polymerase sigma-70 factor (ECF subfamily)